MMTRDCELFRHFSTVLGTNSAKKTCSRKNRLQPMRRLMLLMLLLGCCASTSVIADETPNAQQARRIFNHTYDMVFGPQGSTLQYNVNIIGVMKVKGRIWYKGKKKRYEESRYLSWSDGVKYSRVDMKKKTVTLFDANNPQREKYESKFTFNPLDFDYYVEDGGTDFIVTLNAHKKAKCNIKHAKAIIDKRTRAPKSLKIKLLWFWTSINISHFKSGDISDDTFTFPASKYKDFTWIDNRLKK